MATELTTVPTETGLAVGDEFHFNDVSETALNRITAANMAVALYGLASKYAEIGVAVSDETTNLATGVGKAYFRMPYAMTVTGVRASVNTAPTGSTIIVDINEGAGAGTTILSTKLSIDASEFTSTTATSAVVISDASLADDAQISIDIDQVGSTIPGKGLKVWIIGIRA